MRSTVSRWGGSLIAVLVLTTIGGPAAGHDEACDLELRQAPIEEVPAPTGWAWREVVITPAGWRGTTEWSGGDIRVATFTMSCAVDPAGLFERRAEVRHSIWDEAIELDALIGDETAAWRSSRTGTTHLEWRADGVVGEIVGEWNTSMAELAAIALALETARSTGVAETAELDQ